jgi:hypothetical protein
MIPKDGFLIENAGAELQPGRSIRGLMLCQFPTDYRPVEDHIHGGVLIPSLRLHMRDSANDEDFLSLDNLNQDVNVLRTGFELSPLMWTSVPTKSFPMANEAAGGNSPCLLETHWSKLELPWG